MIDLALKTAEGWIKAVFMQEGDLPTVAKCCELAALVGPQLAHRDDVEKLIQAMLRGATMSEPTTGGWLCAKCGQTWPNGAMHICGFGYSGTTTTPVKCPCCEGWGKRDVWPHSAGTNAAPESVACPACGGGGLVWKAVLR